jgi:hypothetical protein
MSSSGATASDITHWLKRLDLFTNFTKTTQGKVRTFSRSNVIEISLVSRLVRFGLKPNIAAEYAGSLFRLWEKGEPPGWCTFILDAEGVEFVVDSKPLTTEQIDLLDESGYIFMTMNVARLIAKVDEHFREDEVVQ